MRKFVLACAALVLLIAVPAAAQETRGSIEGVIKDTTGGVLPGVTVEATIAGGAPLATVTDAKGIYRFPALAPGKYVVKSTLTGFTPAKLENVNVALGIILTVDLTMAPGGMTESVDVKAESPVIDVKQNAVTQSVTSDVIDLIPKACSTILCALPGLPGAGSENRVGGFGIDGAGASENRYLVDGMDTTSLQNGTLAKDLNINFVDTIQVKQSGYNAEFRASTGGVVSAVTKSGTNKLHGDFNEFLSGEPMKFLRGDIRQQIQSVPSDPTKAEYFTPLQDKSTSSNPTVNVGGPIFSNRLWFFAGFNPQWSRTFRTVKWTTPAAYAGQTQTFDSKSTDNTGLYNITYQVSGNKRLRFSGNNERTTGPLGLPNFTASNGTSNSNAATFNPRSTIYSQGFNDSYVGVFDWNLNTSTYANITGGYLGYGSHSAGGDYYHGTRRTFSTSNINYLDVPANLQQASGYADNNANTWNAQNDFSRFSINGDITKFVTWKGQHSIKGGIQLERFGNVLNNGQQFDNVAISWNASRATLNGTSVRGKYGYYEVRRQYTVGNVHSNNIGLFVQDQWTVNSKLTINYGLRADSTNIPSYREENQGIKFGFGDKLAPRAGFAYDLKGDGRWKAYGSWGVFYDIEKLEMPLGSFGAQHWISYYWTLDDYNWPTIDCDGLSTSKCPGTYIEQVDFRHVSNGQGADNLVDPNLKPFKSEELTFGMDHQLSRTISVGTRYTHKWIDEAIEDVGVQVPGIGEVFYTANPGKGLGEKPLGAAYPATPLPVRHYDGLELRFNRRLQDNWMLNASFLISRLYGSYSGTTSSDESGRNSPNVNRFYDGLFMSFDQNAQPVFGRLQSDRPYQLKIQPAYILPWGTMAGAEIDVLSGLPFSSTVTFTGVPVFVYGRNDLGRTPTVSYVNLNFQQRFKLPRSSSITLALNLDNLFDQDTVTNIGTSPYRDAMTFTQCSNATCANNAFFAGFNTGQVMAQDNAVAGTGRPSPLYKQASGYQGLRQARLQIKFSF